MRGHAAHHLLAHLASDYQYDDYGKGRCASGAPTRRRWHKSAIEWLTSATTSALRQSLGELGCPLFAKGLGVLFLPIATRKAIESAQPGLFGRAIVQLNRALRAIQAAWPRRGGLRRRILIWFLVLSLVPLFLSNSIGYLVTRRIIEGHIERYLHALAGVEAQNVATDVERQQLRLSSVAAGDRFLAAACPLAAAAVRAGRPRDPIVGVLQQTLRRMLPALSPFSELFVVDTSGRIVAASHADRQKTEWFDRELVQRGLKRHPVDQGWPPDDGYRRAGTLFAAPIWDDQGAPVGLLVASVGLEQLQVLAQTPAHLAGDVHTYIVDTQGRPLFVSHDHGAHEASEPLPSPIVASATGTVTQYVNHEGINVIGTAIDIPGTTWRYLAEVSAASAFGDLRSLATLAAGLEVIFALALVGIVWIVARSIVAPLRRLVAAAERIQAGELGVAVHVEREDELGDLGRTFNQMSQQLRTSTSQIQELHDEEMRRAAQLASVGELASGIAHEIKNPLAGMNSGMKLLAKRLGTDPRVTEILSQVQAQLDRMHSAIRDLLSYARPKEPRLALLEPQQLVDRIVPLIEPQAHAAGIRVRRQVAATVPHIRVDAELMTQALVNLALNAIQALPRGGMLGISVQRVRNEVHISVTDTGSGIAAEDQGTIFRPFYTTKHQGTGLGLAITRSIVERHGGRLELQSELGKGSTFTLVLPTGNREGAIDG